MQPFAVQRTEMRTRSSVSNPASYRRREKRASPVARRENQKKVSEQRQQWQQRWAMAAVAAADGSSGGRQQRRARHVTHRCIMRAMHAIAQSARTMEAVCARTCAKMNAPPPTSEGEAAALTLQVGDNKQTY